MLDSKRSRLWLVATGFATFLAMNSFSLWGFSYLPQFAFGDEAVHLWSMPMTLANILSFFAYALGSMRFPKVFGRTPFPEAVISLSCGLIFLLGFYLTQNSPMLVASSVICGIGTTCCFICWENVLALSEIAQAKAQIILGSLLAIVPFLLYLTVNQRAILFIMFLLVFLNLLILFICLRLPSDSRTAEDALPDTDIKQSLKEFALPFFCLLMIGLVSPMLDPGTPAGGFSFFQRGCIVHGSNILGALVLFVMWILMKRPASITKSFLVFYPVLITALLLFPFLKDDYRVAILFLGTFSFTLFSVIMMISCLDISREKALPLSFVYPLFAGVIYASHLLGTSLSGLIAESGLSHDSQVITSVFLLLYGCSLALFLLMRKNSRKTQVVISGPDVISERCQYLSKQNGFSTRQSEVLNLLAHGYDVPSIAKKLFISENTVRTHAKKIYLTLDVHSKQDIVDLANSSSPIIKNRSDKGDV